MKTNNIFISIFICSLLLIFSCKKEVDNSPTVTANFTANQTIIFVGDTVQFTDESTGSIQSWIWEFEAGNPESSVDENPKIIYNSAGQFKVSLEVKDALTSQKIVKPNHIKVQELKLKNLIGHFKLNGNTHDISTLYSASLIYGSPIYTFDRNGNAESAILFENNKQFFTVDELKNNTEIDDNNALTISAWINMNEKDTLWTGIVSQWDKDLFSGINLGVNPINSSIKWDIGGESVESSVGLVQNEWTHIAVTYDGTKLKLYINNILKEEKSYSGGTSSANLTAFTIGAQSNIEKSVFKGAIDDVYIFSRALSKAEITNLYSE